MTLLGIDYGSKNVGIAISHGTGFAVPYKVLENTVFLVGAISAICAKEGVERIIIGESHDFHGRPNPINKKIIEFSKMLHQKTKIPLMFQGETLTTQEAKRIQGKGKGIDASAAALILRSYMEKENGMKKV